MMIDIVVVLILATPAIVWEVLARHDLNCKLIDTERVRDNHRDALNDECKAHGELQRRVDNTMAAMAISDVDTSGISCFLADATEYTDDYERLVLLMGSIRREVIRAQGLFPQPNMLHAAFAEEAGEVANALLENERGTQTRTDFETECVQAAAMACRLYLEGDPSFPATYRGGNCSLQPCAFHRIDALTGWIIQFRNGGYFRGMEHDSSGPSASAQSFDSEASADAFMAENAMMFGVNGGIAVERGGG